MLAAVTLGLALVSSSPSVARLVRLPIRTNFPQSGQASRIYAGIKPGFDFTEVIPSWNIDNASNGAIRIEVRLSSTTASSVWYTMADWSGDKEWSPRQSTEGQRDTLASVMTDTLRAKNPCDRVDVRITLRTRDAAQTIPKLKLLTLCFADTRTTKVAENSEPSGYVPSLVDVPERAQGNYPNGKVLCSATSTSMLLCHWSKLLNRPELDHDVPEVEASVWDPIYKGAGNWPFNTAYFGSFPGMKACVSRFTSLEDLEIMTHAGVPVACSVSFDMLRGRPLSKGESGHLVIVVGFQADGTPILNDPAFKDGVRKTYPREDFEKAWCYSHRTVYLMVPDEVQLPPDVHKIWGFRASK
jgi:hypothetical protein